MARNSQSPSQTVSSALPFLLLFTASTLASLPVQTLSEVPQGCSLHPQEELVSCRGVNVTLLQEFLLGLASPSPPPKPTNITTTTPHSINTTTTPRTPDKNTTITSPQTTTTTTRSSSSSIQRASGGVTELTCVGCQIPKLEATLFNSNASSITLQRLSIIDSGLQEVLHDALSSYTHTLVHLDLSYNLLITIPKAVLSLVRLQVVDLRHNGIHGVDGGLKLTSRNSLRYMYLDHNQLGQTVGKGEKSVFDLWNVDHTFMLPRLTHLGLSFNDIKDVPSGAFHRLTNLLHLDLSHNLLTSLHRNDLPSSLLNLDLAGNPWNCTCEAAWILKQRSDRPLATTTTSVLSTSIISPTCFSPLHLRRRQLDSLTVPAVCPSEDTSSNDEVVYIGDDVEGPLRDAFKSLRLLNATSLTIYALLVSWRVDGAFYSLSTASLQPLSWAVTVRDVTQDPREAHVTRLRLDRYKTEQPQWVPGDGLFAEVLDGLDTGKTYVICLTVMQQRRLYTRPGHCLHGSTLSTVSTPSPSVSPVTTTPESLQSYSSPDYNIRTEAFMVRSESRTASLSWNVTVLPRKGRSIPLVSGENLLLQPLGWRVSYRRAGEDGDGDGEEEEVVLVSHGGEPLQNFTNSYSIEGLQAGTRYVFCLHTLTDKEVRESLTENNNFNNKKSLQDESFVQSISSLPWEEHSHTLPTTPRGRSIVNSGIGVDSQHLESKTDALPPSLPSSNAGKAIAQTHTVPEAHTPVPPPTNTLPFNHPVNPSRQGFVHSFPSQPPSGSFSNVPPIPPSLPPLPHNRPPRPPQPQSGGGFVYTSSGKKIPLPSGPSGLVPPFGVPPPVFVRDPGPPRDFPSSSVPQLPSPSPSRQRFIYEFDENPKVPPPPPQLSPGSRPQLYTYQTRRRRSAEEHRLSSVHAVPLCQEVVTPVELDVVLPAAIAATISCAATVVVVLVVCCCCWPRRCCQRKGAWRSRSIRSAYDSRKVSTISSPTIGTVLSGHTSGAAGPGTTLNEGNAAISRGQALEDSNKASRIISTTSSSGYLSPMNSQNDRGPNVQSSDRKAAYLSLMQSRLLQKHKDLPEFHPGYDIPPTASNKSLVGYDYPHPTPVSLDSGSGGTSRSRVSATSLPPQLPSPSSSDSNYNVLVGNNSEHTSPTEMNLNLPVQQPKSSGLSKSVHILPDVTDNSNYIYTGREKPATTTATRTYLKHPPPAKAKNRHRKFGQPQRDAEEHTSIIQSLSRSTPDLVNATTTNEESRSMSSNLSHTNNTSHTLTSLSQPASLTIADSTEDSTNYINLPAVQKDAEVNRQTVTSNTTTNNSKDREPFHTWGGHQAKVRPGMGEVVLSGGTLIEVPEGYVVPKSPQPTPFIRLLVRGQDGPKDHSPNKPPQSPSVQETNPSQGTTCRPIPDTHHNRLVINTAVAL